MIIENEILPVDEPEDGKGVKKSPGMLQKLMYLLSGLWVTLVQELKLVYLIQVLITTMLT